MLKTVLISPYSRKLRNGKENAKNYPHWETVCKLLRENKIDTIHITEEVNEDIGASRKVVGATLEELRKILESCSTWASGDNFLNHFATFYGKAGVVIFSRSDPRIFGYPQNLNLLKDRKYLRPDQFCWWEQCEYDPEAFVEPPIVVAAIMAIC